MNKENKPVSQRTKDTPIRSLLKAISWRIIASGSTFIIVFFIAREHSDQTFNQGLETASYITGIELVAKLLIYYLHERLWTNINWGKNWRVYARKRLEKRQQLS
jgi:uncharacterized membrane protein